MITIIIADDHSVIRNGLKAMIAGSSKISIVGEAADGKELVGLLEKIPCDVVCTDISMPEMDGVEVTKYITKHFPKIKVVCLSMHEEIEFIKKVIDAGATGYVFKDLSKEEFENAVETVYKGKKYFNQKLFDILLRSETSSAGDEIALSDREKEILKLIAEEYTNTEIAKKLFVSIRTVDTHRQNLLQKLNVRNTAGLVKYAIKSNLL